MKFRISFILALVFIASCSSTTRDYKGVYKDSIDLEDLEVPPGLSKPEAGGDSTLIELQRSIKTYSSFEEKLGAKPTARYAQNYEGMRFVRSGNFFWLEVDGAGEEIWDEIKTFFTRLGFKIKREQPRIGYMETDWLENRYDVPTNFLTEFFSGLFSSGYMDKYRVRLEWDQEKKQTRMFINHQGLEEVAEGDPDDNIAVVQTKWVPRQSDPELEIEMLTRFMSFRGLEATIAEQYVGSVKPTELTKLNIEGDTASLTINEPFARSWRHIGIALDRLGFLVEDKNRTAGIYYIELPETFVIPNQGGLFGNLFTDTQEPLHFKYLIILEEKGDVTEVTIKANGEVPEDMKVVTSKILKDLQGSIL